MLYEYLFENVVFPLGAAITGSPLPRYYADLQKSQWLSPAEIQAMQNTKLQRLIQHAYENVPYYRRVMDERGLKPEDITTPADLKKLPVLTKAIIRAQPDDLLAKGANKANLVLGASSGSTGHPLQYYADKPAVELRKAALRRFWNWSGYRLGSKWVRIQLWPRSRLSNKIQFTTKLERCTYIGSYAFDEQKIIESIAIIRKAKPDYIRGYTVPIYLIARYMESHQMDPIPMKAVIGHSETLYPHYREAIEKMFACKVFDTYGGEGMMVAGQCDHGSYHLNDENVITELIRSDGIPAKPGEYGDFVLTDLNNYAMPFIRYNIEDVGMPREGFCSCGRGLSLIQSLVGRETDILKTPDGRFVTMHMFCWVFEYEPSVDQFQVVQEKPDELLLRLVVNAGYNQEIEKRILDVFKDAVGPEVKIVVKYEDDIPVAASGKRRFVVSSIKL